MSSPHSIPAVLSGELPLAPVELPPDVPLADGLALFDDIFTCEAAK